MTEAQLIEKKNQICRQKQLEALRVIQLSLIKLRIDNKCEDINFLYQEENLYTNLLSYRLLKRARFIYNSSILQQISCSLKPKLHDSYEMVKNLINVKRKNSKANSVQLEYLIELKRALFDTIMKIFEYEHLLNFEKQEKSEINRGRIDALSAELYQFHNRPQILTIDLNNNIIVSDTKSAIDNVKQAYNLKTTTNNEKRVVKREHEKEPPTVFKRLKI